MVPTVERGGEQETKAFEAGLAVEILSLQVHQQLTCRLVLPRGSPVDGLRLLDGEGYIARGGSAFETQTRRVQKADICFVCGRSNCDGDVVYIGDDYAFGDLSVKGGHRDDK